MGLFCGGLAESDEGLESNGGHFFGVGAEAEEGQSVIVAESEFLCFWWIWFGI